MTLPDRPLRPERPVQPRPGAIDPPLLLAVNFSVLIDDAMIACAHISALEMASDETQLKRIVSSDDRHQVQWSAPPQQGRLTMARALDADRRLYAWRREALSGKPAVRRVIINHLDRSGTEVLFRWEMPQAWPLRWTGPRYDALHGGIAFEELEIVFDDLLYKGA